MSQYVLKRVGLALLTLVLLSLIIFFAGQVLPGNAGRAILGPFASQQSVVALDHKLGVDRPLVVQYWSWVSGFVRGNLGTSYQFQSPVSSFLFPALGRSLTLGHARELGHFGFHDALREQMHSLTQEVAVTLFDRLANAIEQSHAVVGHRGVPFVVGFSLPTTRG